MNFNSFWDEDYILLENEFLKFTKYVPLESEHYEVWSIKLANLLLLIGSSIDSFLKNALPYSLNTLLSEYDPGNINLCNYGLSNNIKIQPRFIELCNYHSKLQNDRTTMGIFRSTFEEFYQFSNKPVYILSNKEKLIPFSEWGNDRTPEWWKVYRNLKHDRIKHRKSCTLGITLNALAALFLLNIYHLECREYLFYIKDIIRSNMDAKSFDFFEERMKIDTIQPLIAKTEVFGYVYETDGSDYSHPWNILDPANVYGL